MSVGQVRDIQERAHRVSSEFASVCRFFRQFMSALCSPCYVYSNLVYLYFLWRGSVYLRPCLPMHKFWYYLLPQPYTEQSAATKSREGPKKCSLRHGQFSAFPNLEFDPIFWYQYMVLKFLHISDRTSGYEIMFRFATSGFKILLAQINTAMAVNFWHQVFAKSLQLMNWVWVYSFIWQKVFYLFAKIWRFI